MEPWMLATENYSNKWLCYVSLNRIPHFSGAPTSSRLSSVKFTSPKSYSESDVPFTCFSLDMSRSKWKTHVYVHSRPIEREYANFSFVTSIAHVLLWLFASISFAHNHRSKRNHKDIKAKFDLNIVWKKIPHSSFYKDNTFICCFCDNG